jgi:hypothetical protein
MAAATKLASVPVGAKLEKKMVKFREALERREDLNRQWREKIESLMKKYHESCDDGSIVIKWVRPYDHDHEDTFFYPIDVIDYQELLDLIAELTDLYFRQPENYQKIDVITRVELPRDYEKRNLLEDLAHAENHFTFKV